MAITAACGRYGNFQVRPSVYDLRGKQVQNLSAAEVDAHTAANMKMKIKVIENEIARIKAELTEIREMRPGSLSKQRRRRGGRYYQLTYRCNGKGHTEYIRPELVPLVQRELQAHRRFRELIERWTSLAIELCKLEMEKFKAIEKDNSPKGE